MSKFEYSMGKILKLMKRLLCPDTRSPSVDPRFPGSPSQIVVGESRGAGFKIPRKHVQLPQTSYEREVFPDPDIFGPPRTIADLIAGVIAKEASPGASFAQQSCVIPAGQTKITGTTVTMRRSEEQTVTEEVTRTVQPVVAPTIGDVIPIHQGVVAGSQWRRYISPPGRTRVVQDGTLTPSPTARTGTVTPTPAGTPVEKSPENSSGTRR
ncbi:hypothetical protein MPTK1_8g08300 [Marchantia polymorpha subsp. ruderalis]|uniref:Uncharacterized protein n=1 Tax=Marchantia polymorpha TaxID=3197 RepID=A0A2R6WRS9_MARPO|nr:hypothetical protein MARPO_0063s0088 [Marchantia polymorpha]BBN19156.1 hypothetical protein Mp_8g08300 [Marchantia polymorpha subsp. ruderalis]|eukprot:PTQ36556.1 hypothetical protein MARPO_0063s0088 [Marchantia polymorpha]